MTAKKIETHNSATFRAKYLQPEQQADNLFKKDFGLFYIVKVEDMIRLVRLPVPPVRSTTHTFIYLTHGEAIMTIGSETFKIFKNECLFVPAGQVFSFTSHDINKGFLCNFHNDIIIGKFGKNKLLKDFEFLNVWGNPYVSLSISISNFIRQLLRRIYLEYAANGLQHLDIIQSYFIATLCEINQIYQPLSNSRQTTAHVITNKFKELIFANIKSKHKVTDYASLLHITPNHLNRIVKQITGKSPTFWIDETLMLEAKVLLYQTDYLISEVAEEIGIDDQSYFSRLFKNCRVLRHLNFER